MRRNMPNIHGVTNNRQTTHFDARYAFRSDMARLHYDAKRKAATGLDVVDVSVSSSTQAASASEEADTDSILGVGRSMMS